MTRVIPRIAIDFLKRAEACRLVAYRDSVGVPTAGYGHTGSDVVVGARYDQARAERWLLDDVEVAAQRLAHCVKVEVLESLTEHEYAAILSFVFNLGASAGWTIWRVLNRRALDEVPGQILRFYKVRAPGGGYQTLPGLVHRRMAEVALWKTPDAAAAAAIATATPTLAPPSSQTRTIETPPTPGSAPSLAASKTFGASLATAVATAVAAAPVAIVQAQNGAQAVADAIGPYSDRSDWLQHAVGALACFCAVLAVTAVVLHWMQHRRDLLG